MNARPGAWVVGGTTGIGRALAEELVRRGWDVVVSGRSSHELRRLADHLWEARVDTTDANDVATAHRRVSEVVDLDAVVNCAGGSVPGSVIELTDEQWRTAIETKLLGYVRVCRTVLPDLAARRGALVNIIGSSAVSASADYAAGCVGAALTHVTRGLAQEWCPRGVRVFGIHPGPTETDRLRRLVQARMDQDQITTDQARASVAGGMHLGRPFLPSEIAASVADLLGPGGVALSGSVLLADGGASGTWI